MFTFTRKDGSSVVIDTVIEKVPASMALVNEPDGSVSLVITNQDGSTTKTNVTSLIEDTVINSSDTVNATSVTDAVKKVTTYTLVIKPNSIGLSHVDTELTAKFEETQSAKTAAIQAKDNAVAAQNAAIQAKNNAETYASNANTYGTNASVSADESADSALEAKGYAEQAASYKNSAELAKVAAEKARDEAQSIAGGDYATRAELNEHANNVDIHVTSDEKVLWNSKSDFSGEYKDLTNKPTISTFTLLSSNWDSTANTYSFETDYPEATYNLEIALDSTATTAQAEAFNGAQIAGSATSNTIKAYGIVPTVNIPVVLKVVRK